MISPPRSWTPGAGCDSITDHIRRRTSCSKRSSSSSSLSLWADSCSSSSCRSAAITPTRRSFRSRSGIHPPPASSLSAPVSIATATRRSGPGTATLRRSRGWSPATPTKAETTSISPTGCPAMSISMMFAEVINEGEMPPAQYTMIHAGARLTDCRAPTTAAGAAKQPAIAGRLRERLHASTSAHQDRLYHRPCQPRAGDVWPPSSRPAWTWPGSTSRTASRPFTPRPSPGSAQRRRPRESPSLSWVICRAPSCGSASCRRAACPSPRGRRWC